uniref:DWNN domain-containing protein n=1 Tax=Steinernema glaseri TaxID=37863 RepID=A0A1I7YFD4_9BILA
MSSVHYKFRSELQSRTMVIEGLSIQCFALKEKICVAHELRPEAWNLRIFIGSPLKKEIADDEIVHRNSQVVVMRLPREGAPKAAKTTKVEKFHKERPRPTYTPVPHVPPSEWAKMPEEERLQVVLRQSEAKYAQAYRNPEKLHFNKTYIPRNNVVPPDYVCNICNKPGHWIQGCPLKKYKKANGILASELMPCTSDDPLAMVTNDGRFVKRKADQVCLDREKAKKQDSAVRSPSN